MLGVITGVWSGILVISGVSFLSESGLTLVGCSFTLFLFSAVAAFGFLPDGGFDFGIVVFLVTGGEATGFCFTTGGGTFLFGSAFTTGGGAFLFGGDDGSRRQLGTLVTNARFVSNVRS